MCLVIFLSIISCIVNRELYEILQASAFQYYSCAEQSRLNLIFLDKVPIQISKAFYILCISYIHYPLLY